VTLPFRRIAIVNRGEPAARLIRAVRELDAEQRLGLHVIALHTEPDRQALFVRDADEAWSLGSATFEDPRDGRRKNRYLDYDALERALVGTRAEAVWVGWGFVSEHARFAELCRRLGVVFVGPDPEVMRSLGDKIGSKRMAEKAGVPVAPWSGGPVQTLEEARAQADRLGFPLVVKATAGGGGRGIRRAHSHADLPQAFEEARSEALSGFGDDTVFMERLLLGARHIEVQIVGDGQGSCWALGVRDCTVQRRNQKVIEETPSPALSEDEQRAACEAAARLGLEAGYRNAGTVEFLFDPRERTLSFMEVNARLQVEHPVTECTTGVDLVKLQLHVAGGGRLEGEPPPARGHAIEVRVNAEDAERGFLPTPGRIELFRLPTGPGVRVDTGFVEGDRIAPEFDSMIAKVIAHGRDRAEAMSRLERALQEMRLAVRGGSSNKGFLLGLLGRPEVQSGEVDVGWLDRLAAEGDHLPSQHADVALVQAAIEAFEDERRVERQQFLATAARGRLKLRHSVGHDVELRCRGLRYALHVRRIGPDDYRVDVDGARIDVNVERLGPLERRLRIGGRLHRVLTLEAGLDRLVEVDGIPHRLSRDDAGLVRAPAPAVVLQLPVAPGERVEAGARLAVLEAMKTELPVLAPFAGVVRELCVTRNVQVDAGAPILVLDAEAGQESGDDRARVRFTTSSAPPPQEPHAARLAELDAQRRLLLGFDVEPSEAASRAPAPGGPEAEDVQRAEDDLLRIFTDVCALFEHRTADPEEAGPEARSPEEYLLLYLRSFDPEAAGLSASFVERLERALRHYGIERLDRTPALEEALLWICTAHQRVDEQVRAVIDILERRLEAADRRGTPGSDALRDTLGRVVRVARGRFPSVSDLAREVLYAAYDRPFLDRIREGHHAQAEERVRALVAGADPDTEATLWQGLVDCPEPLTTNFLGRFGALDEAHRRVMMGAILRRYYRIRSLEDVFFFELGDRFAVSTRYAREDRSVRLLATHAALDDLPRAARALAEHVSTIPASEDVVIDLYAWREGRREDDARTEEQVRAALLAAGFPRPARRIAVVVASTSAGHGMGALQHFTYRQREQGLEEEVIWRGLHPMMAKRLELWRLSNFEVRRLPSAEDVYLFHGTARSNPKDERLFAFAEVRDLTPLRDEAGRTERFPRLEFMLLETFAAIRHFQSQRPARKRLHWNRVCLYAWPPLHQAFDRLTETAHRLLPEVEDLGLQKVVVRARIPDAGTGTLQDRVLQIATPAGREVMLSLRPPASEPIAPLSEYERQVVRMRQRGLLHPYQLIELLTPPRGTQADLPPGEFEEYDLDASGEIVPVKRPPGTNKAKMVVGVITNHTSRHPEGMKRVLLVGDPTRELGSFAEPECRIIIGAIALARRLGVPLEWFPVSAGAKIAMDSGTENLDWTALALRRLIEFTQDGGEVNLVVTNINVGGQSYWNGEATMLMHTRGILVMTPEASMVLTGKRALDYSGGVSAEDHQGIGGYERIMGVNGQGQYWASDVGEACRILFRYYEHSYVAPGEHHPRRAASTDPVDRDVCLHPYRPVEDGFQRVGDVFRNETNPGRRKPFAIRSVMSAVIDQDHAPLERWRDMREAEVAVVWDAHLGGWPVCLIGFESKPIPRLGFVPADGPDQWTGGTLFPLSSKKVARAINAASGSRPVVILANLSGFDGSPESLRRLQLEYGAEIGRAVVNFRGPIVFCVISRYHGGAYVVFSPQLNDNLEAAALEGSYASVIGGAPAAAVVFSAEVDKRARDDARIRELDARIQEADETSRGRLRARWREVYDGVRSEKLGEVAEEFDGVHSVQRAKQVGSLDEIVSPSGLRPYLVDAVERGLGRLAEGRTRR